MGKKSTWFSAIKRVFTSNSKDKPLNEADKTSWKEKKGGRGGRLKHVSFIPLFREPSSIEKILGEVDQQHLFIGHPQQQQLQQQQQPQEQQQQQQQQLQQQQQQPQEQHQQQQEQQQQQQEQQQQQQHEQQQQQQQQQKQQQQPSSISGTPISPIFRPRITSPPPRPASTYPPRVRPTEVSHRPQPTLQQQHISATSIQAAYRGHMARRKVRGLTGHVKLQGVVRGQNVKRQTVNAMKQMQLLVRVQTQIQSRRIQMLENQALKRQANNNDKQAESSLGNNPSEMGDEYWDDSFITKEGKEARLQKKVEAVTKRERAMAFAYSHKLGKATPTSAAQTSLMDIRTGGYPWWWNWLDRQLPSHSPQPPKNRLFTTTSFRTTPDHKPSHKQLDTPTTPMSSRSMEPSRTRSRTPPNRMMKYSKAGGGGSPYSMKDDDSLMSCPAFSVPNYMSPTISAKAKARPTSNPKDRVSPSTPGSETSKRRFSFPFTPDSNHRNRSPQSVGDMSVNSAISMPASLGRKPFNRFV